MHKQLKVSARNEAVDTWRLARVERGGEVGVKLLVYEALSY